jgi:hypothetical protein
MATRATLHAVDATATHDHHLACGAWASPHTALAVYGVWSFGERLVLRPPLRRPRRCPTYFGPFYNEDLASAFYVEARDKLLETSTTIHALAQNTSEDRITP